MEPTHGYVYVSNEEPNAMAAVSPGVVVRNPSRKPPWIVVDHDLQNIIIAKWPGRLWRVEIVDPISRAEQGDSAPLPSAPYTRSCAVRVLEELPASILFGSHGQVVCAIIDVSGQLSLEHATALAAARHPKAGEAQTRVWRTWLAAQRIESSFRLVAVPQAEDSLDGTLDVSVVGMKSPIGEGLSVIHGAVGDAAEVACGKAAWIDEEDDDGAWLKEPWATAARAMLDAAHAFAAPESVTLEDRAILAKAWREVIGADPLPSSNK